MEVGSGGWFSPKGNSEEPPQVLQREIQEAPEDHGPCGHPGHRVMMNSDDYSRIMNFAYKKIAKRNNLMSVHDR